MSLLRSPIPEQELERAKNILVSGIYMNIEKQSDRLEELTRNVISPRSRSNAMAALRSTSSKRTFARSVPRMFRKKWIPCSSGPLLSCWRETRQLAKFGRRVNCFRLYWVGSDVIILTYSISLLEVVELVFEVGVFSVFVVVLFLHQSQLLILILQLGLKVFALCITLRNHLL